MHNPNMPPLIVLGLTGPVGSGCTTVSNVLFDDPNSRERGRGIELLTALKFAGWIRITGRFQFEIDWEALNKEVDGGYRRLATVSQIVEQAESCESAGDLSKLRADSESRLNEIYGGILEGDFKEQLDKLKKKLIGELVGVLELREATKALAKLEWYYREGEHLFRTISVSTLIVFDVLKSISNGEFDPGKIKKDSKRTIYKRFVDVAKKCMDEEEVISVLNKARVRNYSEYLENCRDWKEKSKERINEVSQAFYDLYKIAEITKREFQKRYPDRYAEVLQDFGDNIRRYGEPFGIKVARPHLNASKTAERVAQFVYLLYVTGKGAFFVIDCLRNPYEVIYLRKEFANFFLLSLYADKEKREERFIRKAKKTWGEKFEESKARKVFEATERRDSGKNIRGHEVLYKQNVTKCVQISHIAINNRQEIRGKGARAIEIIKELCRKNLRILSLILSPGCTKPDTGEMFMNLAYTMAVKSNCISRQVGTVIIGPKGYVVGAGWNDSGEGRIRCGLRAIRDLSADEFRPLVEALSNKDESAEKLIERLCKLVSNKNKSIPAEQFCFCFKDEMAKKIVTKQIKDARDEINKELKAKGKDEIKLGISTIRDLVAKAEVHQLESCLALHAEENAIIQSSKIGGMGLKGGIVYTTAEPCTLCAKKIQQVGIKRVVYTVAYPESLSEVYMKGVELEQFEGVKPRAYIKLFMPHHDQKEWQYLESQELVPVI